MRPIRVVVLALLLSAAACSTSSPATASGPLKVVAAENVWGSIASQIGGTRATVTSIITNPATDPHSYEPTPADGRVIATADVVIVNGIGYDAWATNLLAANGGGRTVINAGTVLNVGAGGNPHRWYNPAEVETMAARMAGELSRLDPAGGGYFGAQLARFETAALGDYHALISSIAARYAGTPVGASESIFSMLAPALGLNLITPDPFLRAITQGTDVSAADKSLIDNQIRNHLLRIYVYNSQNSTPDVAAQVKECQASGIPTPAITETLVPATATYQDWQVTQLKGIQAALARATGH